MAISGLMDSGESKYFYWTIMMIAADIGRPSSAVTCASGEELRKTVYADVLGVLQESGMLDEYL